MVKSFFIFIVFVSFFAEAEIIRLYGQIDRKSVPLNASFILSVNIEFKGSRPSVYISNVSSLGIEVLSQWTEMQSSTSFVNGRRQSSKFLKYKYRLQAKAKGRLRLESLDVNVEGKEYKTKDLFIDITDEDKKFSPNPLIRPFGLPSNNNSINIFSNDPFSNPFFNRSQRAFPISKLQTQVSKKRVYRGEAIRVNWLLLVTSGARYNIDKRPQLKNFWKEAILKNPQGRFLGSVVEGNTVYQKTLFDSMVLFPLKAGELTIDSYSLELFSILGTRAQTKNSPSVSVFVQELPVDSKNVFSGAVGNFKVTASIDSSSLLNVNSPIRYTLLFKGNGHPQFINLPKINFPDSIQVYDPVEKSEFKENKNSFKKYEIILIPKTEGSIVIPAFEISTFDPHQERYIYHQIPSFKLNIAKGKQSLPESAKFTEDEAAQIPADNKIYMEYWPSFLNHNKLKFFWVMFYVLIFFGFMTPVILSLRYKNRSTKEKLKEGLKSVEDLIRESEWQQASIQLMNLFYLVLYQFDNKKESSGSWLELVKNLPPSLNKKYGKSLEETMQHLEMLSFAPQHLSKIEAAKTIKKLHQKAEQILKDLTS